MAMLADVRPLPSYLIAGATHPKVLATDGEAYREMLQRRCWSTRAVRSVTFDESYRDLPALTRLIGSADLVVLPYDSDDQVTSGVLVDAVACGRPVVATAFPHAVELLSGGAGIVVPQRDAGSARRRRRRPRRSPRAPRADGDGVPTLGARPVLAGRGRPLRRARHIAAGRRGDGVIAPEPSFAHIVAMSDGIGTFEHAEHSLPRDRGGVLHRRHGPGADRRLPGAGRRRCRRRSLPHGVPLPGRRPRRRRQGPQPAIGRRALARTAGRRGLLGPRHVGVRDRRRAGARGLDAPGRGVVLRPRARAADELAPSDGVRRAGRGRGAGRPPTTRRGPTPARRCRRRRRAAPAPTRRGRGPSAG